jgi:MFS family permease
MIDKFLFTLKRFIKHPLFLSFYLPSFLVSLAWGVRIPILPLYASEISSGYGLVGLVVAGAGLGTLVADLPAGRFILRMNKRQAMILGISMDALSTLALFWVDSIWLAIGLRFISGAGHAVFSITRHIHITHAVRTGLRGRAISLFGGVMRIGLFVSPALGVVLAAQYGLRLPFVAFALVSLAAIGVLALAKDGFESTKTGAAAPTAAPAGGLRQAMAGRFWLFSAASIGHILAQIIRAGEQLILPLWGADVLMLSPAQIGWVVSMTSAVSATLFYPVGLIMDHWGRKFAIVPSFLIMGVALAALLLTSGFWGLMLVSGLVGLGHGLGSGTMMTLGSDLSPKEGRSAYLSAWRLIGDAGNSGGPLILGWVAQALTLPLAALTIAGAGLLAGAVFTFLVPETLKKASQGVMADQPDTG